MLPIFNSEDSDGISCIPIRVPAHGLPSPLSSATLAS
jgi:hypothetical protein